MAPAATAEIEDPAPGPAVAASFEIAEHIGLGGSLILGFLDLQSSQAQNRFYNEVEEKLSQHTKFTLLNMDENDKKNQAFSFRRSSSSRFSLSSFE